MENNRESVLEKLLKDSSDDFSEFKKKIEKFLPTVFTEKKGKDYIYYITKIGSRRSPFNISLRDEALLIGWHEIRLDSNNFYVLKVEEYNLPKKTKSKR